MKFSVIIPLVAVGALAATPVQRSPSLVERDLATITSVINTISTKVDALDAAAKAFSGDKTALQSASDAVLSAINDGNSQIAASDSISLTDALSLTTIITNFEGKINTTVDDVIAKKDALVSAGLGDLVHQSFVDQKSAASTLAATITSKVPSDVQSVATQLSAGIAAALQRGVDAFANTGSSPSSSASAPGSTASAPGSSASSPGSSASASGSSASASGSPTPTESGSTPTSGSGSSASGSPSASGSASTYSAASSSAAVFTGAAVPIGRAGFGPAAAAVIAMVAAL